MHKRRFLGETSNWNLRFTSTHSRRWKMRVYWKDLFGGLVKTEYFVSRSYYRRKTFLKKFIIFFIFGLSAKISWMLGRNFFGWKKILFNIWLWANDFQATAPEETFGGKIFLRIESLSHQFPTFSSWFSGFWQKKGRARKTASYVSRGKFWQETNFEKKDHPFR